MKILLIGLDSASPEILFSDERLQNLRRVMEIGCYGRLEGVIPSQAVPTWMCMAASQDPGSLGVYGSHNRLDRSYDSLVAVDSASVKADSIWDHLASAGKRSVLIGALPSYPLRKINGIMVGDAFTIPPGSADFAYPAEFMGEINDLVGDYPNNEKGFHASDLEKLREQIVSASRKQFQLARHFLKTQQWDYFHFVDRGLDLIQRRFWQFFDPRHTLYEPGNAYKDVIPDYYLYLDEQIGQILELLTDDTVVLIVSGYGAQRLDGGFCLNEWLIDEGWLALNEYPQEKTPFNQLNVNWAKTKAWSAGDRSAQIFLNLKGREPEGTLELADGPGFRDELRSRLEALVNDSGESMGALVFKPEEIYRHVHNVVPDLIAQFGGAWQFINEVGYHKFRFPYAPEDLIGCHPSQFGAFILAASNNPLSGEVQATQLLDIAPTLLELAGYEIPASMQGRSIVAGQSLEVEGTSDLTKDEEEILRERLSGLGYIS
jgi:predicted AlkP superfamily phosphohydrolase/phosphomutase